MARKPRRIYTPEQKADAVRMAREVGNAAEVARRLDLPPNTLLKWLKKADLDEGKGPEGALTSNERAEIQRLRSEVRRLEQERDFLKKAAAFFAKESDRPSR